MSHGLSCELPVRVIISDKEYDYWQTVVEVFILLLSDGSTMKSVCTYSLKVSESLFHSISISYNPTLILKRAKKIYAYGWKAFLCCSLIFCWEKYSENFLKYNCAPRELNYIFEKFLWRLLSILNIGFNTWSELRVISCLTSTQAKTQGHKPRHKDSYQYASWYSLASRGSCAAWMHASEKLQVGLVQGDKRAVDFASEDSEL